jgi:hypothetical protein
MRFSPLAILPLITAILATPIPDAEPEAAPEPQEVGVAGIPGINITNAAVAGTADVVKGSYIIVYKDNISEDAAKKFETKVSQKLGKGVKGSYRLKSTTGSGASFAASSVETDRKGLEAIANDPAVSYPDQHDS